MEKAGERKIGKSIEETTKQEMANKTKARAIVKDKWGRKKYLQDVIKIRLHMWQVNSNYKRDNSDTKCPLCKNQKTLQSMC